MPHREKFSEKSVQAFSSQNQMWEGVELVEGEEEDAPDWREFRDEVDFCLGAIEQLTKERERERNTLKSTNIDQYKK